jgi:hypothetical protein
VTPDPALLAAAYLAELWPVCREVPRDVRAGWAAVAADRNEVLAEQLGEPELPFQGVA